MLHVEPLVDFLDLALALGLVALGASILVMIAVIYIFHFLKGGNERGKAL